MKYFLGLVMILNVMAAVAGDSEHPVEKKYKFFDLHDKYYHNRLYLYWGYNRDRYSNSNIHIYGKGFNFTIYDVAAHDKPTRFSAAVYFGPSTITINQTVMMTGYIDSSVSQKYGGVYNNRPVEITPDFLTVQHTNGLNSVTLDVAWLLPIFHTRDDILHIGWNFGTGGVFVVTRTQVHFMGVWYPNSFHLSGVTWPAYTGPRIDLWKCFFFAAELKGGYVYLPWAPFIGTDQSGVIHHFTYMEYYIVGGLSFPLDKKEYPFIKWKKRKAQQIEG
jgi:hypothetical protein